jgi:hypothetical protein
MKSRPEEPEFYILWNPDHPAPPRVRFYKRKDAVEAALRMAGEFPPDKFYVCKAVAKAKSKSLPPETTKLRRNSK